MVQRPIQQGHEGAKFGVVGGAETQKRSSIVTGVRDVFEDDIEHLLGRTFAHGAVDHSRLTKTASVEAAAPHFNDGVIVDGSDDRNHGTHGTIVLRDVEPARLDSCGSGGVAWADGVDGAILFVRDFIKHWNVDPGDAGKNSQEFRTGELLFFRFGGGGKDFNKHFFSVADDESVDKIGHGLGRIRPFASGNNEGGKRRCDHKREQEFAQGRGFRGRLYSSARAEG